MFQAFFDAGLMKNPVPKKALEKKQANCSFDFANLTIKKLMQKEGNAFELILYRLIRETNLFDDVQTGVHIEWDDKGLWDKDLHYQDYFDNNPGYGIGHYVKAREYVNEKSEIFVENELDVVLMKDMRMTFISCKNRKSFDKEMLYEIASLAAHFKAQPVMAITEDLSNPQQNDMEPFVMRAKAKGITLIGSNTIFNPDKFRECMLKLAEGKR